MRNAGEKRFPSMSDWNYWKVVVGVVVPIFFGAYRMTSVLAARDSFDGSGRPLSLY